MATKDPYPLGFRIDEGGNIVDPAPADLAADVFKRMIEDQPQMRIYCASEAAIIAAAAAYPGNDPALLAHALIAAHHPALLEHRSVCLRDILLALENGYHPQNPSHAHPVDFLWAKFVAIPKS